MNGKELFALYQQTGIPPDVLIPMIVDVARLKGLSAEITMEGYDEAKKAHGNLSRKNNTKLGMRALYNGVDSSQK